MSIIEAIRSQVMAQTQAAAAAQTSSAGAILAGVGAAAGAAGPQVDVEQSLQGIADAKGRKSNWRTSIVDLMMLLDLDSSLDNRKELATELGYTGEKNGSAEMNIWLHRKVMEDLERNGGRVSEALKN